MISRRMRMIDLDPRMMRQFTGYLDRLRPDKRQLSIWHEDGIVRRSLIGDEVVSSGLVRIEDARRIAENLYRIYENEVERVLITDFEGRSRLAAGWNVAPRKDEHPYEYLRRRIDSVAAQFDSKLSIYPELDLNRGPLDFLTANRVLNSLVGNKSSALVLAVIDGDKLEMLLAARVSKGRAVTFTNACRWEGIRNEVRMDSEWLAGTSAVISETLDTDRAFVCCLSARMMRRLFDGRTKTHIPYGYQEGKDYLTYPDSLDELEGHEPAVYIPGFFAYIPFPALLDNSI